MVCDCIPKRHTVVTLLTLGMCIIHMMRVNVAMTVVVILDKTLPEQHKGGVTVAPPSFEVPAATWDPFMIGVLHAVFYIGYLITQIPAGYLCTVIPANRLFGAAVLASCSLNLLVPVSIDRISYWFTCTVRFLQGMSEGFLFPSCYAVMRHWTVPSERSSAGAAMLTGLYIGPTIGLATSGYIAHFLGWPFMFYIFGGLGLVWFIFWLFLIHQTPADHPHITNEELKYIQKQQGESAIFYAHDRVPWWDIFTSLPVWSLNVANFGRNFVFLLLLTNEPAYLNAFRFTIKENGLYSALPHLVMTIIAAASGPLADMAMRDKMLSPTNVRKMFTCLGFGAESLCLFILFFMYEGTAALIFLTIGVGLSGFTISGWQINHLDLAPRYASVLVGISMTFGTLAGIMSPILAGHMTKHQTVPEWQKVWIVTAAILCFIVIFYGLFGSGEKQAWAEPKPAEVLLVSKADPLAGAYYKTVRTQTDLSHFDDPTSDSSLERELQESNPAAGDTAATDKHSEHDVTQNGISDVRHRKPTDSQNTNPFEETETENSTYDIYDDKNPFAKTSKEKSNIVNSS